VKRLSIAALTATLLACATVGWAERPITQDKFVYDPQQGYILAWAGPMKGKTSYKDYLDFVRVDPATGKTLIEDPGFARTTNARVVKDAAAIYYEAKPWAIVDDRGLFLIPVNPGRWVIGGVNNTALSLGSYAFQVEPGKISYIGTVLTGKEDGSSGVPEIRALAPAGNGPAPQRSNIASTFVLRLPDSADLPSSFPKEHVIVPKIERDVRFNNYQSSLVSRAADLGPMGHEWPVPKSETYTYPP
jgi:hypothetical protein